MPDIDFEARRAWLDASLEAFAASGTRILVAEDDGQAAGFLTLDLQQGIIDQLAVAPGRQGRGIATALLDAAKALRPAGLELVVNRDNPAARRLYARHGFGEMSDGVNPASGLPTLTLRWTRSGVSCCC